MVTSRRSGQRRDDTERGTNRRRDVGSNVTTLQRVGLKTSRRSVSTLRRSRGSLKFTSRRFLLTSRRSRGYQNRRRDVRNPRRDVTETTKIDVAMLEFHVATFQRRVKLASRRLNVATLERRDVTEKAPKNFSLHIKQPWFTRISPLVNVILWTCNALQNLILPRTFVFKS